MSFVEEKGWKIVAYLGRVVAGSKVSDTRHDELNRLTVSATVLTAVPVLLRTAPGRVENAVTMTEY